MQEIKKTTVSELVDMADARSSEIVKAAVDHGLKRFVVDGETYDELTQYLVETGADANDIWCIDIYPKNYGNPRFMDGCPDSANGREPGDEVTSIQSVRAAMAKSLAEGRIFE